MLAELGLERMDLAEGIAETHRAEIRQQLDSARGFLADISGNILAQVAVVRNVQSMVTALHSFVFVELRSSWDLFGRTISRVWYVDNIPP